MKKAVARKGFVWIADAGQDLRWAVRMLSRHPGFASLAIVTMGLGVGATTTLFSLAYGVLLRPLPWPEPERLVRLEETRGGNRGRIPLTISNGSYLAWRDAPSTIEDIGGWTREDSMTLAGDGEAERLPVGRITPSLLRVLRVRPTIGRSFVDADADPGRPGVALLGFGLWQRRFGGHPDVVNRTIRLDGRQFTIVGVMPRDFVFPNRDTQMWTPLTIMAVNAEVGGGPVIRLMIFSALARRRPGVTLPQAAAEGTARARSGPGVATAGLALFASNGDAAITAAPARDALIAEVRPAIVILLAAVGLLFVTATASLAVLQLSRMTSRRREIAVRTAIGARTGRLVRQWVVESMLLGMAGGSVGLLIAAVLHIGLPKVLPPTFPRVEDVRLDGQVALFTSIITVIASVVCGVVPAWHGRDENIVGSLSQDASVTRSGIRRPAARTRGLIMAGQIAVACVLLVGASLLLRRFTALLNVDRGFDPRSLVTARIALPPQSTFERQKSFIEAIERRLGAVPGVTHVGFGNALPFVTTGGFQGMNMPSPNNPGVMLPVQTVTRYVSPGYFSAMRLRIVAGRPLLTSDTPTSPPVVVVNKSFATKYLGERAVGQRLPLGIGTQTQREVVGVVDDMRQGTILNASAPAFGGVLDPPQPEVFLSYTQTAVPVRELVIVARAALEPGSLAPALRTMVRDEDPSLALDSVMTMEDRVSSSLAVPRTYAVFLAAFAGFAVVIAGVGLFGVLSHTTAQRTPEIGLRTALGARRGDILGLIVGQAVPMTIGGLAVGLLSAFFLAEALSKLLYGVSTRDAASFVAVPLIVIIVAAVACAVPAWRATRLDPLRAMRSD